MTRAKLRETISDFEKGAPFHYSQKGYPLGPLAEEYAAKIAPKAKQPGYFQLPMKPPTHMEYYEEDVLANVIKEMIEIDKDVEQRKNRLALMCDFNMHDFYAIFDIEDKGSINFREFQEVFDMFRIFPSTDFLRLCFQNLDRDLDQKLTLKEFLFGLTPKDKNYQDLLLARGSYNDKTNFSRL